MKITPEEMRRMAIMQEDEDEAASEQQLALLRKLLVAAETKVRLAEGVGLRFEIEPEGVKGFVSVVGGSVYAQEMTLVMLATRKALNPETEALCDTVRLDWLEAHFEQIGQSVTLEAPKFQYWSPREQRNLVGGNLRTAVDAAIAEAVNLPPAA